MGRSVQIKAWLALALWTLPSAAALGQQPTVLALANPPYHQDFRPNPLVGGNLLVGLRWGSDRAGADASQAFNPDTVQLRVPDQVRGQNICVEIASQDGRYSAENAYHVPADASAQSKLEGPKTLGKDLEAYLADQMAVMIRAVRSCDALGSGPLVPALIGDQLHVPAGAALIASVNADPDTVTVTLLGPGGRVVGAPQPCASSSATRVWIAYRADCAIAIPLALAPGVYQLDLTLQESFKPFSELIAVLLGPAPTGKATAVR